jgi:hypothetical protein
MSSEPWDHMLSKKLLEFVSVDCWCWWKSALGSPNPPDLPSFRLNCFFLPLCMASGSRHRLADLHIETHVLAIAEALTNLHKLLSLAEMSGMCWRQEISMEN